MKHFINSEKIILMFLIPEELIITFMKHKTEDSGNSLSFRHQTKGRYSGQETF